MKRRTPSGRPEKTAKSSQKISARARTTIAVAHICRAFLFIEDILYEKWICTRGCEIPRRILLDI
jgi:hypothetical protein